MFRSARTAALASIVALAPVFALAVATPALAVPHAGDTAPAFALPKAKGGTLTLAQLRGRPVYLNFFASWCAPCNSEAGSVAGIYQKYRKRGLAIVGVNEQEDKSKALGFARKYRWPFDVVLDEGAMGRDYGALALPVHVFVDKSGKVSTYRLGEMAPSEIDDAIKKIL